MVFYLKKIFAVILDPVFLSVVVFFAGVIMLYAGKKKQRAGKLFMVSGLVILMISSCGITSDCLLYSLEKACPVFKPDRENTDGVKWIVILGGGKIGCDGVSMSGRLNQDSIQRMAEGIFLSRAVPKAKIIVSGGIPVNGITNARAYEMTAIGLGVERSRIVLEERPRDTFEEAVMIRRKVGKDRFILVTSAYHMKRAAGIFRKQGMKPIPAPAGHLVESCTIFKPENMLFTSRGINNTTRAVHEYAGLLYSKITGQI
jgi:uncharacterized SAM-binding protein YcdF (DUF218 family)